MVRALNDLSIQSTAARPLPDALRRAAPKRIVLLGATGSVGRSCVQVILGAGRRYETVAVAGGADGAGLARAAIALGASFAAVADPAAYSQLKDGVAGHGIEIAAGPMAVVEAAVRNADLVIAAIAGTSGLAPTFAAIEAGRRVALANKETLVCAGHAMMEAARASGAIILPMDSEHNAIFQAMAGCDPARIVKMTLTASGGPFREWSAQRIAAATKVEALAHPNWAMGKKITIDSASMMNKGLELIEAHHLFGVDAGRLDVLVHPQSIVHGMVSFVDGSVIAGMATPDMRTPIAHCLAFPDRMPSGGRALDLAAIGSLTFEHVDYERFPALRLATKALAAGGGATAALNSANEVAVSAFLADRIRFADLAQIVGATLEQMDIAGETTPPETIAQALAIHHIARDRALALLA